MTIFTEPSNYYNVKKLRDIERYAAIEGRRNAVVVRDTITHVDTEKASGEKKQREGG